MRLIVEMFKLVILDKWEDVVLGGLVGLAFLLMIKV